MIKLKSLSYSYNDFKVLDNFNLEIKSGEFIAIKGNNGSGKSTLALILAGLLNNYEGEYLIDGNEPSKHFIRENIGILFQDPENQLVSSTVKNDIAFGLENRCVDPKEMDKYIDEALRKLDMLEFKDFPVSVLSGGQKQKVALAGLFVMNFNIYIFDEATSMLDPESSKEILNQIFELHKEGKTIIMITHKSDEAKLAERVVEI